MMYPSIQDSHRALRIQVPRLVAESQLGLLYQMTAVQNDLSMTSGRWRCLRVPKDFRSKADIHMRYLNPT